MAAKIIVLGFGLWGKAMYSFNIYNQKPESKYSLRSLFSGKTSHLQEQTDIWRTAKSQSNPPPVWDFVSFFKCDISNNLFHPSLHKKVNFPKMLNNAYDDKNKEQ